MNWDEHADGWDHDPAVQAFAGAAFEAVSQHLKATGLTLDNLRVLDFGCGTGLLTRALASTCRHVVGLDPAPKMVAVLRQEIAAKSWTHVHAFEGTLEDALADASQPLAAGFDLVVCSSVCAFLEDYSATARKLSDLLRPGGVFMQFDWERDDTASDPFGLTRSEIEAALTDAGLLSVHVGTGFELAMGEYVMKPLMGTGRRPEAPQA